MTNKRTADISIDAHRSDSKVRIRVTLILDVDREEWDLSYGSGETIEELRDDVKRYILNNIQQSPAADDGAITATRLG